mmetsp:Transcript_14588/g.27356  ORF Transcript_14588/g.27356 Transcript_14588/m.27356 type:complete len:249 (+) Transcript_14588:90-836(+)
MGHLARHLVLASLLTPLRGFDLLNIGAPRTGTQTIAAALSKLGMKVLHTGYNESVRPTVCSHVRGEIPDELLQALLDEYDAAMDEPFQLEYEFVMEAYPKAKFVLPLAEADRWIRSYQHFFENLELRSEREAANAIARGLTVKRQDVLQAMAVQKEDWLQRFPVSNYCNACRYWGCRFQNIIGMSEATLSTCKQGLEDHMARVKTIIPPERLLIYNLSDGWKPLCDFLGKPIPDEPFPYVDVFEPEHW